MNYLKLTCLRSERRVFTFAVVSHVLAARWHPSRRCSGAIRDTLIVMVVRCGDHLACVGGMPRLAKTLLRSLPVTRATHAASQTTRGRQSDDERSTNEFKGHSGDGSKRFCVCCDLRSEVTQNSMLLQQLSKADASRCHSESCL